MSKGGARPGAGRKPGVPNKRTAEKVAAVEASGLTPLDYMLSLLRDKNGTKEDRMWAAEKAAPYVHAKLAAVEMSGKDGGPVEMVTRIELVGPDDDDSQG
jgi:hypothetical protein